MTDREAMQLALDALQEALKIDSLKDSRKFELVTAPKAMAALRQALAEPDMGIDRGAWDDVPDATKWVDELRGGDETEQEPSDDDAAWARYLKEPMSEKSVHKSDTMERECNPHPDAPHGFNRDASHGLGRYVCDCEGWEPPNVSQEPQTMPEKTDDVAQEIQPEQKPVAWLATNNERGGISCLVFKHSEAVQFGDQIESLYTAPPKREWVGLTDEEIDYLDMETSGTVHDFVHAIEAKLKEKNHA